MTLYLYIPTFSLLETTLLSELTCRVSPFNTRNIGFLLFMRVSYRPLGSLIPQISAFLFQLIIKYESNLDTHIFLLLKENNLMYHKSLTEQNAYNVDAINVIEKCKKKKEKRKKKKVVGICE